MDKFTSMQVLCRVIERENFSAAARELKISPAMVTKHVAALEEQLGIRLLNRTTRRVSTTEAGEQYYQKCRRILSDLEETEASVSELSGAPRGKLRISAPMDFGITHLAPAIGCYMKQHPQVRIEIDFTDRLINLLDDGYDLAIRISRLQDSSLVAQRVMTSRQILCAAPSYLEKHGTPQTPADLKQHNCLTYAYSTGNNEFRLSKGDEAFTVRFTGNLHANNGRALVMAAVSGVGVICKPDFLVRDFLNSGELVPLLSDYQFEAGNEVNVYAVYPHREYLPAKVKTFIEFLKQHLAQEANG